MTDGQSERLRFGARQKEQVLDDLFQVADLVHLHLHGLLLVRRQLLVNEGLLRFKPQQRQGRFYSCEASALKRRI